MNTLSLNKIYQLYFIKYTTRQSVRGKPLDAGESGRNNLSFLITSLGYVGYATYSQINKQLTQNKVFHIPYIDIYYFPSFSEEASGSNQLQDHIYLFQELQENILTANCSRKQSFVAQRKKGNEETGLTLISVPVGSAPEPVVIG